MSPLVDLERIKARLAEIDAEREPLLALIRAAEAYENVVGKTLFTSAAVNPRPRTRPDVLGGRSAPIMAATERAVSEILEAMGPLSTSDLMKLLSDRPDLNLPEKNPVNVLSARLSNSEHFETQRGVGWWFKGRPWPTRYVASAAEVEAIVDSLLAADPA